MSEEKTTHDVVVHKGSITLADGESLSQFTSKLRDAGSKFMASKLNLMKDSSVYPIEIFGKSIVFDVYQYGPNVPAEKRQRFYAAAYTRKDSGDFEFSTMTEVERVTTYQAKQTAVAKSKDAKTQSAPEQRAELTNAPGWVQTKKAFWAGVI